MMGTSSSIVAYEDCYDFLDRALEAEHGVGTRMANDGDANQFRVRLHNARTLARSQSKEIYQPDHPQYGTSVYDKLVVSLRKVNGEWWVYVTTRKAPIEIVELGEDGIPPN
jgi:hypothetical protein